MLQDHRSFVVEQHSEDGGDKTGSMERNQDFLKMAEKVGFYTIQKSVLLYICMCINPKSENNGFIPVISQDL